MNPDPAKWIEQVLGVELWETQKHLIEAYTSGKPLCIHRGHVPRDQNLALVNWLTALFVQSGRGTADPIADLKLWNKLFNKSPQPVTSFWMSNGLAKQVYEAAAKLEAEAAKRKTIEISSRLSPAEIVVIDEASRITPFEWEGLARATETLRPTGPYGRSRERAQYKRILGIDPAGNCIDCSVSVMRHEDGTLYHEGKDYEVKDGVITALPGGRLWGGKHETMSIGYTLETAKPKERPPLHNPKPWNPPVAKRRKQ